MDMLFAKVLFDKKLDKEKATQAILEVDKSKWFWDPYRNTRMLSLMTIGGGFGPRGTSVYKSGEFEWVDYTPQIIREWFDDVVFPWMGCRTRIMALMTQPSFKNNEHVDCDEDKVGTKQHKFRIVLQGRTGTLYYKTTEGDVAVPDIDEPFIMDGSWPHGMINDTSELKLTIAAGIPWVGNDSYDNIEMLMKRSDYTMPNDVERYFIPKDIKELMKANSIS